MNRVWSYSREGGSPLLALLALADCADDEGVCFPGVPLLAQKIRLSDKQVGRILRKLTKGKELVEVSKATPRTKAVYRVLINRDTYRSESGHPVPPQSGQDVHTQSGQDVQSDSVDKMSPQSGHFEKSGVDISAPPPTPPYKADPLNTDPSVTNVTGADAPSTNKIEELASHAKAKSTEDFTIWTLGVKALLPSCIREDQARSFLGKAIKDHGKANVCAAIVEMLAQTPINPKEYLQKVLQNASSRDVGYFDPGKQVVDPETRMWNLATQSVEFVMYVEKVTLDEALARLADPLQRGKQLDGITDEMIQQVIAYFDPKWTAPKAATA